MEGYPERAECDFTQPHMYTDSKIPTVDRVVDVLDDSWGWIKKNENQEDGDLANVSE